MDGFLLRNIQPLGIIKERVVLRSFGNSSGFNEGGGSGSGRTSRRLFARAGMVVRTASNFVTYEALIVAHVLRSLGRGESEDIYVHGIGVAMRGRGQPVSSRRDIGMASKMQLLESLGDIIKLTGLC